MTDFNYPPKSCQTCNVPAFHPPEPVANCTASILSYTIYEYTYISDNQKFDCLSRNYRVSGLAQKIIGTGKIFLRVPATTTTVAAENLRENVQFGSPRLLLQQGWIKWKT